ncbi:MAG: (d)CMP kinase [Planctomycetota bacterium]
MIVTIDGPAGAGKSSIAHQVAEELGFEFLDTGAMYRAVTWAAMTAGIDMLDVAALVEFADRSELHWVDNRIWINGLDATEHIRTPEVTAVISAVADQPVIRAKLSDHQRRLAQGRDIVTEGRDQGAEVFPDAPCKIFLTASPLERARRRQKQLADAGRDATMDEILDAQNRRDQEDESREVGRLRAAEDAVVVNTDGMTHSEVLQAVLSVVQDTRAK